MSLAFGLNARLTGALGDPVIVFLHGFGCGQEMWRHVAPAFEKTHAVLCLDLPGSGGTDASTWDRQRHAELDGYAADVLQVLDELRLDDVVLVGHSVAAMIGVLAQRAAPQVVTRLVMVSPSARYIDDGDYRGGFSAADIDDLMGLMERNHLGWQDPLASLVAGGPEGESRPELHESFCRTRPDIAAAFGSTTFRGDNRADLAHVSAPTLVLQVRHDLVAPMSAGEFIRGAIPGCELRVIETQGHAPHLTAPAEVIDAIGQFVAGHGGR